VGLTAVIAAADLAAQGGGAAALDRGERAALHTGQALTGEERGGVRAHDVGELDRTASAPCAGARSTRGVGALEQLQRRRGGREMAVGEVEVAQRRADVAVTHEPLDRVHVDPGLEQVGGEGVAQRVDAPLLGDAGTGLGRAVDALRGDDRDRPLLTPVALADEQPVLGPITEPVAA
jgi:hypothetical protein